MLANAAYPQRYGTLDVSNDDFSFDAFAAVAEAIRHPGAVNPLGGLRVERVFATGHSQSASRLATYVNSIHPLAPVFDAVVVHGGGRRIRDDLGSVKVFKLLSETDVIGSPTAPNVTPGLRGAAPARGGAPASAGRAASPAASRASSNAGGCDRPPYSHIPFYQVMDAAFDHLVRWVKDGTPPPAAPKIETSSVGPPAVVVRDARGNALGGIRLAAHAVPTGVNTGQNSGPGFCRLCGSHEDFDAATLASLYPTHDAYVAAVRTVTEQNLKAGYILQADADATIAEAERSAIGR